MLKRLNIHISQTTLQNRSRIMKETRSLIDSGLIDHIIMVGFPEKGLSEHEYIDDNREIWRINLNFGSLPRNSITRILMMLEFSLKALIKLRKYKPIIMQCHSLETLPIVILYKALFHKEMRIVYDAHELETEKKVIGNNPVLKKAYKLLEKILIKKVDYTFTVSNSIMEWYKNTYSEIKNIDVIRNVPINPQSVKSSENTSVVTDGDLKKGFNIPDDHILFIYQGGFITDRSINTLLDVFTKVDKSKHIVFMGKGPLENTIKDYEKRFKNIHFQPAVRPDQIISYTRSADVGLSLPEDTCLNHQFCLPNKLFEYFLSRIPIIVSDFPEMRKFIDDNDAGWKIIPSEKNILDLVNHISKKDVETMKKRILDSQKDFGWHREEKKLIKAYHSLIEN